MRVRLCHKQQQDIEWEEKNVRKRERGGTRDIHTHECNAILEEMLHMIPGRNTPLPFSTLLRS